MATRLVWHGAAVLAKAERATQAAIDEVTKLAAEDAKRSHWWTSRTRQLEAEVINEPAKKVGPKRIRGKFGTTKTRGFYGLFHERKTPFLRPAGDRVFPLLAKLIGRRIG